VTEDLDDVLDDVLDHLEELDEADETDALRATLAEALTRFPDAPELREWEASLAAEDERFDDALAILDGVLASHPDRRWARHERAAVLMELGRFGDALAALRALPRPDDAIEGAALHFDQGVCLDHLGDAASADAEFERAARRAPEHYPMPLRLSQARFEAIVADALDDIPEEFLPYLDQVVVRVREWPGASDDPSLMGLYVGVARPDRTVLTEDHLDHVVVFKRAHELQAIDEDELREEVRRTVVHEIAHHFGIEHEDMGTYH
jgi:predicted Zn-dependent protease with MMP-like domain